ncbi:hypothetical protein GGI25_005102 [Coemansia spiralis]|uniref:DUF1168-domain-containing protein n=2 Tax=Coemansia TaxID=4863 RepID=A0A9W8FZ81_9FUNG|nr:hypothetical protein EDC05_005009 [Coemansia umbellata]KAJ2620015.1 hypothetical protein GGI26_005364 [Coemansia sp. RSA 1358]KAJ2672499.1 hypothetical protein GGI25_005102 [Coemansia spiralis]
MAKDGTQKHNEIEKTIEIAAGSTEIKNQRLHIEKLMQNIDQPIELSEPKKPTVKPPPEIVLNVRGSSAGAGSSDFHTYREQRRKENLRIQLMEKAAAEDEEKERFAREMASLKRKDEEKTAKNRAKRLKKKQNRSGKANLDNKDKE